MARKHPGQSILENAYELESPADNVAYYRAFAPTYDTDFAAELGWFYPQAIAEIYHRAAVPADLPIADIGCGTGFVAAKLGLAARDIDGMDISPEMLEIARQKILYRALHQVDLTGPLGQFAGHYGAVLSAGTFTHGHLGPGPLRALLEIARPGALFVIGVNEVHYEKQRFGEALDAMRDTGQITGLRLDPIKMYSKAGHDHSDDGAFVLQYRKCPPASAAP